MINLKRITTEKTLNNFSEEEKYLLNILFDPKILITKNIPKIDEEDDNDYNISEIVLQSFIKLYEKNLETSINYALEQFSISNYNNILRPILLKRNITNLSYKNFKNLQDTYKLKYNTKCKEYNLYYCENISDDIYYIRIINNKIFINDKDNNFIVDSNFNFLKPLNKDIIFFSYKKNDIYYIFDWLTLEDYYKEKCTFIIEDRLDFLEYIYTLIDNNNVKISEKLSINNKEDIIDKDVMLIKRESYFEFKKTENLIRLKLK